jgi:hypothetical protein
LKVSFILELSQFVDRKRLLVPEGDVNTVRSRDVAHLKQGQKHAINTITLLHKIEVQTCIVPYEFDIERFS